METRHLDRRLGVVFTILSGLAAAVSGLFIMFSKDYFHVFQFNVFRPGMTFLFLVPLLGIKKTPFMVNDAKLWITCLSFVAANNFYVGAVVTLGYADASALCYSAPVFAGILGCLMLREPCGITETTLVILALIGTVLVIQPPFMWHHFTSDKSAIWTKGRQESNSSAIRENYTSVVDRIHSEASFELSDIAVKLDTLENNNGLPTQSPRKSSARQLNHEGSKNQRKPQRQHENFTIGDSRQQSEGGQNRTRTTVDDHQFNSYTIPRWIGCLMGVSSAFFTALYLTLNRLMVNHHFTTKLVQQSIVETTFNAILLYVLNKWSFPRMATPWLCMLGTSSGAAIARLFVLLALRYEHASVVATVRTSQIVFAYVLQVLFTSKIPNVYSISGAVIISFCACVCGILRWKRDHADAQAYLKLPEEQDVQDGSR